MHAPGLSNQLAAMALCTVLAAGCSTPTVTNTAAAGLMTVGLGHTPTTNIVQTYYLGVFDPREQLPPTIYRVRVQGQASALAWTKFASGWVHSDLVDSLSGRIELDQSGVRLGDAGKNGLSKELDKGQLNRRLVLFGPEGFREAPKNHRLVVVMGSNPEGFFSAVDRALGAVAGVTQPSLAGPDVVREVWADMARMREERRAMQTLIDLIGKD
jgi:hypothetical protein